MVLEDLPTALRSHAHKEDGFSAFFQNYGAGPQEGKRSALGRKEGLFGPAESV